MYNIFLRSNSKMSECRCDASHFIQTNEGFLLTVTATLSAMFGLLLNTCIKSRCTEIKICGLTCLRNPIPADQIDEIRVEADQPNAQTA